MEQPKTVSLDRALMSLKRGSENFETSVTSELMIEYLDRIPGYDNSQMKFFHTFHEGDPYRDIFTVNEHMAVLLTIVTNTLVILVFVRVLGMTRLPSRLMVNLAIMNIVSSAGVLLHRESVSLNSLSGSVGMCRFLALLDQECYNLFHYGLCSTMVERMVACSMISYYSRAQHILAPVFIFSPWAIFFFCLFLFNIVDFELDFGYECGSHINVVLPEPAMSTGKRCAYIMAAMCVCGVVLTAVMHNQSSGDVWEISRTQFELRTTIVVLKLVFTVVLFTICDALAQLYLVNGLTYEETRMTHIAWQLCIHRGLALIMVLLSRQEFRRHLFLVFESSESIRRTRTTNLLIAHSPTRQPFYRPSAMHSESLEEGTSRTQPAHGQTLTGAGPSSGAPTSGYTAASTGVGIDRALVSRDKLTAVQTPDWLRKKEVEPPYHIFKLWAKLKPSSPAPSSYSSVV